MLVALLNVFENAQQFRIEAVDLFGELREQVRRLLASKVRRGHVMLEPVAPGFADLLVGKGGHNARLRLAACGIPDRDVGGGLRSGDTPAH